MSNAQVKCTYKRRSIAIVVKRIENKHERLLCQIELISVPYKWLNGWEIALMNQTRIIFIWSIFLQHAFASRTHSINISRISFYCPRMFDRKSTGIAAIMLYRLDGSCREAALKKLITSVLVSDYGNISALYLLVDVFTKNAEHLSFSVSITNCKTIMWLVYFICSNINFNNSAIKSKCTLLEKMLCYFIYSNKKDPQGRHPHKTMNK